MIHPVERDAAFIAARKDRWELAVAKRSWFAIRLWLLN